MKNYRERLSTNELDITKKEILDFCDKIIEKWEKDSSKNFQDILAINAVKASVSWTNDRSLRFIWSEILKWAFELLTRDAIVEAKKERFNQFEPTELEKPEQNTKADIHGEWF